MKESGQEETTRYKLIKAARYLIAHNGYQLTSTRMIANQAGVTLSAIAFHFGSKEELCRVMLEESAEVIRKAFKPVKDEIDAFLAAGNGDRDKAFSFIDTLLKMQIHYSLDPRNEQLVLLVQNGQTLPGDLSNILYDAIMGSIEDKLTDLIFYIQDEKNIRAAHCVSRATNGAIMTFIEKPLLTEKIRIEPEQHTDMQRLERYLHRYFMDSIKNEFIKKK